MQTYPAIQWDGKDDGFGQAAEYIFLITGVLTWYVVFDMEKRAFCLVLNAFVLLKSLLEASLKQASFSMPLYD